MRSVIGTHVEMETSFIYQEIFQAVMWLGVAVIGWVASTSLLSMLGWKRGLKNRKATVGSAAFRQEVALYARKTSLGVAARHFGLHEAQVQQYCSDVQGQTSNVKTEPTTEAAGDNSLAAEAPLFTAPSTHAGHVLLEHYDVFHPREGAWSGPLEEQVESESEPEESPATPKSECTIPLSAFQEIRAEEFFEGSDSISLWLVPEGHVYDHFSQSWSTDS